MSATNPLPPSGTSGDKRSYEPSMEEILASIRRIIADDQGLPTRGGPIGDPASTVESSHELLRMPVPHRPAAPAPADPAPQPAVVLPTPESSEPAPSPHQQPPPALAEGEPIPAVPHGVAAHGPIAAPQYPAPDGRVGGDVTPMARAPAPPDPTPVAADPLDVLPEAQPHAQAPAPTPLEREDEMFDAPIEPKPALDPTPLFSATTDAAVSSAFSMLAASRLADNSEELMNIAKEMIRPMLRAWLDDNLPSMVERMVRAEIERVARGGR